MSPKKKKEEEKKGEREQRIEENTVIFLRVISSESGAHSEPIHTQTHSKHPNVCFRKWRGGGIIFLDY